MPAKKAKYRNSVVDTPPATPAPAPAVQITPRYLGTREATQYLGFRSQISCWRWLKRAIADGLLHADLSTRPFRFDREELDRAFAVRTGRAAA